MVRTLAAAGVAAVVLTAAVGCSGSSSSVPDAQPSPTGTDKYLCEAMVRLDQKILERDEQLSQGGSFTEEQGIATLYSGVGGVVVVLPDDAPAEVRQVSDKWADLMRSPTTSTSDLSKWVASDLPILVDYGTQVCPGAG